MQAQCWEMQLKTWKSNGNTWKCNSNVRKCNSNTRNCKQKLGNVMIIIFFNLVFLLPMIPQIGLSEYLHYLPFTYDKSIGIGYIILANLIASSIVLLLLIPTILNTRWGFDFIIWKKMIRFGAPLIVVGLAGMINELIDRVLLLLLPLLLCAQ